MIPVTAVFLPLVRAARDGKRARRLRSIPACVRACLLAFAVAPASIFAANPPITYVLDLREPASHLVQITMTVPEAAAGTEIQFPAWNALYQIRDFVRNVQ